MSKLLSIFMTASLLLIYALAISQTKTLRNTFPSPPPQYKPGVYWYFMDGNMSAETMTKDLEAMHEAGIGNLIFLEVNVGIPRGKVDFFSDEWIQLFAHAEREARRLGIEITLGIGPGWTGSGGPWVRGEESMQHLVASKTTISAGQDQAIKLPIPAPKPMYFGGSDNISAVKSEWESYYKDVAVIAFREKQVSSAMDDIERKALYFRDPYSSKIVPSYLEAAGEDKNSEFHVRKEDIVDLTSKMAPDGTLDWRPESGSWTVMRFVSRNNGSITRPAPYPGLGMEADKMDTLAINKHLDRYIGRIINALDSGVSRRSGGLVALHMDSWEMGAQNWTVSFREEFIKRRKYDPMPYYPVYEGIIVDNQETSERFLWDLRQTAQELAIQYHAEYVKQYAHQLGLSLSIEPYDMTPMADLELGSVADVPMGEFWSKNYGYNTAYSIIQAASIAHINGKPLVPAEAFTAEKNEGWKQHPASMKNQGDWAFAAGVNRLVFHTFQNQFLPDELRPGATMGPYGIHWDRNQTFWPFVSAYHDYLSRCQYLLQQGRTKADILYLTPEGAPHVFVPPASALVGDTIGDRRGYNFDGCAPGQLMKAMVKEGKITFPNGASYEVLVMADYPAMTPKLLNKLEELVRSGATVIGNPPKRAPSLENYPKQDLEVANLATRLWGSNTLPDSIRSKTHGQGRVFWGKSLEREQPSLFPSYESVQNILKMKEVYEDFQADSTLRYTHRMGEDWDLYFISNKTDKQSNAKVRLKSPTGVPERWNPIDGSVSSLSDYYQDGIYTTIDLKLAPYESTFIMISREDSDVSSEKSEKAEKTAYHSVTRKPLDGSWQVSFDPQWGGPESTTFEKLIDWSKHADEGIKYYSGIACYSKDFTLSEKSGRTILELGDVKNIARVTINGQLISTLWTAPWELDISEAAVIGNNTVKIEVANLWTNRLIGDEQREYDGITGDQWPSWLLNQAPRPSNRYTFTTAKHYDASDELQPSGLIGPVCIRIEE